MMFIALRDLRSGALNSITFTPSAVGEETAVHDAAEMTTFVRQALDHALDDRAGLLVLARQS